MSFKNFEILLTFISFVILVFASPIKIEDDKKSNELIKEITPTEKIQSITNGFSVAEFRGNYTLDNVIYALGSDNDTEFINYILTATDNTPTSNYTIKANGMMGSAFSVPKKDNDGYYVGRNLDFNASHHNLVLVNYPEGDYSSISTVNTDFIKQVEKEDTPITDETLRLISIFSPLDGLNEKGVSVSINMNQGDKFSVPRNEKTKVNVTPSMLVRIILDRAASTDKAIDILRSLELHNTFDFNVHFMISDNSGKSVAVEYVPDEIKGSKIKITETSVVTNFNLFTGDKSGPGLEQYNIINEMKANTSNMSVDDVKNTLEAAKDSTQCSIVYDLSNREATYYIGENYQEGYKIKFEKFLDDSFPANPEDDNDFETVELHFSEKMQSIKGTTARYTEYTEDYGLDEFIKQNGVKTEKELIEFIYKRKGHSLDKLNSNESIEGMACSVFSVQNEKEDGYYFGRNYDWNNGTALILVTRPENGYASISTIDTNFLSWLAIGKSVDDVIYGSYSGPAENSDLTDKVLKDIAVYFPFDGINEKGLSFSLNVTPSILATNQNDPNKLNVSRTAMMRIILDKAATVDEAIELMRNANMHTNNIHFTISDATGKTVVVEYKYNEKTGGDMFVTESPVVTNYNLADDEDLKELNSDVLCKDKRFDILMDRITKKPHQDVKDVRNTLRAGNQGDFTAWSIVFDQVNMEATYFIRNNYTVGYHVQLLDDNLSSDEEETLIIDDSSIQEVLDEDEDEENDDDDDKTIVNEKN